LNRKYLYLFSDFENYKRNTARERIDLMQTAGRDIVTALLPILDDFDRAAKNGGLPEGIQLIHNKIQHTLNRLFIGNIIYRPICVLYQYRRINIFNIQYIC
jgi:molecular chaperone GrpE (heat shock protein)